MSKAEINVVQQVHTVESSTLLFLTFLVLKLTGVISWSWVWVTAPLWGSVALVIAIVLLVALCVFIATGVTSVIRR